MKHVFNKFSFSCIRAKNNRCVSIRSTHFIPVQTALDTLSKPEYLLLSHTRLYSFKINRACIIFCKINPAENDCEAPVQEAYIHSFFRTNGICF